MKEVIDKIIQEFKDRGDELVAIVPDLLGAIVLFLVGWIIARILKAIISKSLKTVQVDRLSDRLGEVDLFSRLNLKFSSLFAKLIYYALMLIVLVMASNVAGIESIPNAVNSFFAYLPQLISAILLFVVGVFIADGLKKIVTAATLSMNIAGGKVISNFVFYFLLVIIAISALNQAGMDTDVISQNITLIIGAVLLAFGIGYGFASRDILANVLASFYSKDKFTLGQTIRIGNVEGTIIKMDSTSVTLDADDKKIVMPLSKLLNSTVEIL